MIYLNLFQFLLLLIELKLAAQQLHLVPECQSSLQSRQLQQTKIEEIPINLNTFVPYSFMVPPQETVTMRFQYVGCDIPETFDSLRIEIQNPSKPIKVTKVVCSGQTTSQNDDYILHQGNNEIYIQRDQILNCPCTNKQVNFEQNILNTNQQPLDVLVQLTKLYVSQTTSDTNYYATIFAVATVVILLIIGIGCFLCFRDSSKKKYQEQQKYLDALIPAKTLNKACRDNPELGLITECQICMIQWKDSDLVRVVPCKHLFHQKCIDKWMKKQQNCPCCRSSLTKQSLELAILPKYAYTDLQYQDIPIKPDQYIPTRMTNLNIKHQVFTIEPVLDDNQRPQIDFTSNPINQNQQNNLKHEDINLETKKKNQYTRYNFK